MTVVIGLIIVALIIGALFKVVRETTSHLYRKANPNAQARYDAKMLQLALMGTSGSPVLGWVLSAGGLSLVAAGG